MKKVFLPLLALLCISLSIVAQPAGYVRGTQVCWNFNGRDHGYFRAAGNGERHILISFTGIGENTCSELAAQSPQKLLRDNGINWDGRTVRAPGDTIVWEVFTLLHTSSFTTDTYALDIDHFFHNIAAIDTSNHSRFHIQGLSAGARNIWLYLFNNSNHNSPYRHIFSTTITMSTPQIDNWMKPRITAASAGKRHWVWHGLNDAHTCCPHRHSDTLFKYLSGTKRLTKQAGGGHNAVTWDSCLSLKGNDINTNRWKWMVTAGSAREGSLVDNSPVQDMPGNNKMFIYPNPAHNKVMITFDKPDAAWQLMITDIMGRQHRVINNIRQPNYTLDISSLQKGIYFIQVESRNYRQQWKLMKE